MNKEPRLLIVEDDPLHQLVLRKGLTRNGMSLDLAGSGEQAKQFIAEHIRNYDLVLLDMDLPDATGLELLQEIRAHVDQNRLPVIIFSGNERDDTVIKGLEQGANDYVFKSVELPILLARIRANLAACDLHRDTVSNTQHQVMRESLGAACHYISQPMTAATTAVEMLCEQEKGVDGPLAEDLSNIVHWISAAGKEIHRLQNVNEYRTEEYCDGVRILDPS